MAKFCSLFSSSKGNSTYLASNNTRILIDAGVSCKRLCEALQKRGIDPASIDAVLLTHEHSDHTKALKVFCSKYGTPVYASAGTIRAIDRSGLLNGNFIAYEFAPGSTMEIGDLKITSFRTSHDVNESSCYTVTFPDERVATVLTDTGVITEDIHNAIKDSDLILLESNHDINMLKVGPYPYELKRRILSDEGHLCNEVCAKECVRLANGKTTRFFLGHLSEENNSPYLAYQATATELEANGIRIGKDCLLEVCKPEGDGKIVPF